MKAYRANDVDDAYKQIAYDLVHHPDYTCSPRGQRITELCDVSVRIAEPRRRILFCPERNLSVRYAAGELAFYLAGSGSLAFIAHYSKFWNKISDDGKSVNSAYGKRLFDDEHSVIEYGPRPGELFHSACVELYTSFDAARLHLLNDPDSRKAVMPIYRPDDCSLTTKDTPCTMYLQFLIRENKLHCSAHMRSNDVWKGFPYDVAFFTVVQERMLIALRKKYTDLEMGSYVHHAGSLHCYERDWEGIARVSAHAYFPTGMMNEMSPEFEAQLYPFLFREHELRTETKLSSFMTSQELVDPFLKELFLMLTHKEEE
jgi:thymidylate synthase